MQSSPLAQRESVARAFVLGHGKIQHRDKLRFQFGKQLAIPAGNTVGCGCLSSGRTICGTELKRFLISFRHEGSAEPVISSFRHPNQTVGAKEFG